MGETSLPTSRDSIRSTSSQETTGDDSSRQRSINGKPVVESKPQLISQTEIKQSIKPPTSATTTTSAASTSTSRADPPRNYHHGKPSESSMDSIVNEANQGLHAMPPRHEQPLASTVVVNMPPEQPGTNHQSSEQRSVTPSDLSNAGSVALTNSASPNPKQVVQQHREKPPPAPIIQHVQQQPQSTKQQVTTPTTQVPPHPGKPIPQQPAQRDAPQLKERTGSRFTITPVSSAPVVPVQPPIQQPQDRRPSLATSTATTSTQQLGRSAPQHADTQQQTSQEHQLQSLNALQVDTASQQSNSSQPQPSHEQHPQHMPVETIAPLPATPASVPSKMPLPQTLKHRSVSVPCAPQPYPPQFPVQPEVARSISEQSGESQQTYFYQIPGVIPVQTMPPTNTPGGQQAQQQIIGTVGAIPVMKLQQDGVHYVKKGRFKLFQQAPPAPAPAPAMVSNPAVVTTPPETAAAGARVIQPVVSSAPIVAPTEKSQSPKGAVAQVAAQRTETSAFVEQSATTAPPSAVNGNPTPHPETFDGSSVPTVKKKGRFLVSNVKDVRTMLPTQKPFVALAPVESVPPQQALQLPTMTQPAVNQQPPQSAIVAGTQPPAVQPVIQNVVQTTVPVQETTVEEFPTVDGVPVGALRTASPFFSLQGTAVISEPYAFNPRTSQKLETHPQPLPGQSHRMTIVHQVPLEATATVTQTPVLSNAQASTPPQTPAVPSAAPTSLTHESPRRPMHVKSLSEIPKATEKARATPAVPKKKVSSRTAPHAMDRGGKLSLGKLSYLLDQMKSEVTDADQLIKTLQTDLKLMRDKNKELEAKNGNLEKGLKEEKSLREKAEARNIELRKMMREASIPVGTNSQKPLDQTTDSSATSSTAKTKTIGALFSQTKAAEDVATGPKVKAPEGVVSSNIQRDPTTVPLAPNSEKQSKSKSVLGVSIGDGPATNGISITPTKVLVSGSNSLGREQSKRAVAIGWHTRSNSLGNANDAFLQQVTADSTNASPAKPNGGAQRLPRTESVGGANSIQGAPKSGAPGFQKTPCVRQFDPLHQNQAAGDVLPFMIPTQMSLVNAASPVFQNHNDVPAYNTRASSLPLQYEQNQLVAQNNFVVPITVGMARAINQANMENGMQHQDSNHDLHSLQQPSFMVLSQQQPVMVQQLQGGVQQVPNLVARQVPQAFTSNENALPPYVPSMMQQLSPEQTPSQLFYSLDSFDPLK